MIPDKWRRVLGQVRVRDRNYILILRMAFIYSLAVSLVPLFRAVPSMPLQLAVLLLIYLLYSAAGIPDTVRRWFFYVLLTLSYQSLRTVVNTYTGEFHGRGVVDFETAIFGKLPTETLQELLYIPGRITWYDNVLAILHASLFLLPILIPALLLIFRGRERMKRATVALVMLSLSGYLTYVLFPLTPPWMASIEGFAPQLDRLVFKALRGVLGPWLASAFQPSPRGAMPSLHTAVPLLVLFILRREFGKHALWFLPYPLIICFEIVYGAEHYVIDILAGVLYAVVTYIVVYKYLIPDRRVDTETERTGQGKT